MPDTDRRWVESMAAVYEEWLVPAVFRPFAVDLARRVAARSPERVLELAAGTGVLTREVLAKVPSAQVTATDLNDAMVGLGRRHAPAASWRQADAMHLPYEDAAFDLVACQFGVMFLPDKPAGFGETRRVLTGDGGFLFNVWSSLDTHGFEVALMAVLAELFPDDPPTFLASIPHGYADPDLTVADLAAGGLRAVSVESCTVEGHAPSAAELAAGYCRGTPVRAEIEARGDVERTAEEVARRMEALLGTGPVTWPMTAHVVEAVPDR